MEQQRIEEALGTVDAFASVGVKRFSLTCTDLSGKKVEHGYWAGRNLAAMRLLLPHLVPRCWQLHQNLIIRPTPPAGAVLGQLDDLDARRREEISSRAFLVVQTSPGNYQVWIAIVGAEAGFVSRLVKGIGADSSASRAGRLPGTPNCKSKYEPDFPVVRTFLIQPGRIAMPVELEGFLAAPVQLPSPQFYPGMESPGWPDYEWVLRGAPKKKDGTPDRSRADYFWCKWSLERGHGQSAVIAKLAQVSQRAQAEIERGNPGYLRITVANAARGAK